MLRVVVSIVAGYVALAVFVMATFTLTWTLMGQEIAFYPETARMTPAWLAATLPLNFLAAVLGGWVAACLAGERAQVAAGGLAAVILLLGLGSALAGLLSPSSDPAAAPPPPASLGAFEAAAWAVQPTWFTWVIPFVAAAAVLLGGRLRWRKGRAR